MAVASMPGPLPGEKPWTLTAAAVLSVINAVGSIAPLPFISGDVPAAAFVLSIAFGVVVLAGVWGMWGGLKWAAIVVFIVTGLNALASIPGMFEGPTATIRVLTAVGTPLLVATCILIAVRPTRRALH